MWHILTEYDSSYGYQPDPNDNWIEQTTVLAVLPDKLCKAYGVENLEAFVGDERKQVDLEGFVMGAYPSQVFDVVELFYPDVDERHADFQAEINQALQDEKCPWLLCDGFFFQIDSGFLEERVLKRTHELLRAAQFDGALEEFVEARNDLTAGDHKGAILNATKAFESCLKAIQPQSEGSAKKLIDSLKGSSFYDGLPEVLHSGFGDQVLMTLPTLRNKIAGHGQGNTIVEVPKSVAELAVHLSGTFIVFLIGRYLEQTAKPNHAQEVAESIIDDGIPF